MFIEIFCIKSLQCYTCKRHGVNNYNVLHVARHFIRKGGLLLDADDELNQIAGTK